MKKNKVINFFSVLFLCFINCCNYSSRSNQVQPLKSPSDKYIFTIPIERNPEYDNTRVWIVTISDLNGKQLYKDDSSEFVGCLNVYWCWDENDRIWLYNSDDGKVWFWELVDSNWIKTYWGFGKNNREIERDIDQPDSLYPYVEEE